MSQTQLSLRTLLAAVAFAAANIGLFLSGPSWRTGLLALLFFFAIPALSLQLAVNSREPLRSFFLGFFVPSVCVAIAFVVFVIEHWLDLRTVGALNSIAGILNYASLNVATAVMASAFSPVVGLLCVLTHWLLVRPTSAESKD